ncbi:hypothetical protein MLD38_021721 [Melastoma candidum]|uniref:Uncharacterized protein n=1 Tax=Melastoma candidum TaxID=119954 RepID=A0ACB9QG68_9MYRT|nr:hypothetical protein MLD38_021721 [Melastoma candidum]
MERYKILRELGDGACGCVYKAVNMATLEIVAIKKMKRKFYYWEECMNLREVKALRRLDHPNVVKLKEVVRENNELFLVLEYMEHNLYQIIRERHGKPFSEEEIRHYTSQVLQGLDHMHKNAYFHRDLKPENLLVTGNTLKIADLGLARELLSAPPYTEYVSTRWYRAPEVLLQSSSYTPAIDMWAVGAIVAELFTLSPIFPGDSEIDQLYKICNILGLPERSSLPGGADVSRLLNISFSEILPANLSLVIPNASPEAIDLIKQLCSWDPMKRPTAEEALKHPFFHAWKWVPTNPDEKKLDRIGAIPNLELNLWDFRDQTDDCFLGLTLAVNPSDKSLDMIHSVSRGLADDILFGSAFQDDEEPSVYWSLLPPNQNPLPTPVDSSLSLSFSSIRHPSIGGVPLSTGLSLSSLQPNMLDCPVLAARSSFRHWL